MQVKNFQGYKVEYIIEIYHHGYDIGYQQGKLDVREEVIDECLNALCNNCKCANECLGYCQHYKALEELKNEKQG